MLPRGRSNLQNEPTTPPFCFHSSMNSRQQHSGCLHALPIPTTVRRRLAVAALLGVILYSLYSLSSSVWRMAHTPPPPPAPPVTVVQTSTIVRAITTVQTSTVVQTSTAMQTSTIVQTSTITAQTSTIAAETSTITQTKTVVQYEYVDNGPGVMLPPRWDELKGWEKNLPQHNIDLPAPEGRDGRYVRFSNQIQYLGWNNLLNEV